jgi:charged multivesicular body protein 6
VQEVSELLGGKITNQDEEEVEDELAALEAELTQSPTQLPSVPIHQLPKSQVEEEEEPTRLPQGERTAMLAS